MRNSAIKPVGISVLLLFAGLLVQTVTFLTIGKDSLKKDLLADYFVVEHHSDTVYVRDFFLKGVNDRINYHSHDLVKDEDYMKDRLKVKYVIFQK